MSIALEVAFHLKAIRELCVEFGVVRLEVFGSASVGPFDPVDSDLDVLVEFPDGYDYGSSRNVIAHGYDDIDYGTLWDAVEVALPRLIVEVDREMRSLGG